MRLILVALLVVIGLAASAQAGCRPSLTRDPTVRQTKKNMIRVGWGRKLQNKECLKEAKVTYTECGGGVGNGYGMKVVPLKKKGNGASFIVEPDGCYNVWVSLVGTDGSETQSGMLTIQMETEPTIEVVG